MSLPNSNDNPSKLETFLEEVPNTDEIVDDDLPQPQSPTATPEQEKQSFAELVSLLNAKDDDPDTQVTIISVDDYEATTGATNDTEPTEKETS